MKDFLILMQRFIPPYKKNLFLTFVFNALSAIFSVAGIAVLIPILNILLGITQDVHQLLPWQISSEVLYNNAYYYITQVKELYGAASTLLFVGFFLVIATMLKTGFAYLGAYQAVVIRNGVTLDMRNQMFRKILTLPLPFFSDERKGDIMARLMGDVSEVEGSIMSSLDMFLKNPIIIIVTLSTMIMISASLTLFVLLMLPLAGWAIGGVGKSLKKESRKSQQKMGNILSVIEETLSGLRIIKAFNAERKMGDKFKTELEGYKSINNKMMKRRELAHPMSELMGTAVIVVIVWYGGTLIINKTGGLSGSAFLAFVGMFYTIINPAKAFVNAFYSIQKGMAAMERIDNILLAENTIKEVENPKSAQTLNSQIEYRNVTFAYDEKQVLKDVSVVIEKGKTVALVGQSGSGKTTFVDLLPRFHDVVLNGGIYIDGVDIREIKTYDLRELMGNVNQEAILFNDTIYNNIAFGVENATREQVIEAAKVANAHNFIIETEDGYDTNIGDRGGKLSGGQRQRLSIARAILKNPPILILDEATSALDTESERLVQDALERLMKNRTSIVIAHRLSTVRNADLICVFHEGEVVERGTHDELIALNGTYKKLHSLQMR